MPTNSSSLDIQRSIDKDLKENLDGQLVDKDLPVPSSSQHKAPKTESIFDHFVASSASLQLSSTLVCGALAGVAAKTVIAPMERIKMSFQVSSERFTLKAALLRGKTTIEKEGFFSLWKGHSTTVLRVAPYAALSYTFHDLAEVFFQRITNEERLPPAFKFAAGSIGGLVGTLFTYPLDVLRVRIALGGSWKSSVAQGGLFQGLMPTLLGIGPYAGTAWLVKQTLLEFYHVRWPTSKYPQGPSIPESLGINAIAGLMGQFVTYPLDILRRRMQIARPIDQLLQVEMNAMTKGNLKPPSPPKYLSMMEFLRQLWKEEGLRGLGKGFTLNIIKGPISLSVSLTVYDYLLNSTGFRNRDRE